VHLISQKQGLMISAVPDGEDSEASAGVIREVGEQASGHASKKGKQASQPKLTAKCA